MFHDTYLRWPCIYKMCLLAPTSKEFDGFILYYYLEIIFREKNYLEKKSKSDCFRTQVQ